MYNKSIAEKIYKNSFGKVYTQKVFYYYSKKYIENFTKAGQSAIKHCLEKLIWITMTPGDILACCFGFALVCMGISLLVMSFKS